MRVCPLSKQRRHTPTFPCALRPYNKEALHHWQWLQVYAAVERHVDWRIVRCLVIAGPGFMKDQFKDYVFAEAVRRDSRYGLAFTSACDEGMQRTSFQALWYVVSMMIPPCRDLILNKTKIVVAHASSAYKHSLREVLESPGIAGKIKVFLLHSQFVHGLI